MPSFKEFLTSLDAGKLIHLAISQKRQKSNTINRYIVRPFLKDDGLCFQLESFTETQAFHENIDASMLKQRIESLAVNFKQFNIFTADSDYQILINKRGQCMIKSSAPTKKPSVSAHNRVKQYVLPEGKPIDFLVHLGVMNAEGRVHSKKQDKFRQINRYLEMVEDILAYLPTDRPIRIVDFGCGKSYLTFALYYYLNVHLKREAHIIGLDLKDQVIRDCQLLSDQLKYDNLKFVNGDIASYDESSRFDMVITLHACDTATDFALKKAVLWDAAVILSVPCCQHELNGQLTYEPLESILKYGIVKERIAALVTDAIRGNWLEAQGYRVQLLEFIDMAHTPKNILIRACKKPGTGKLQSLESLDSLADKLGATLEILK
ncbi:MAG: SAM-dependent methyltransferase [Candidatus Wallbacteria bacterium HGW-Wallbacteria-1]|uniref:SAM-dependent methyltransferase n=1 Tax=Candidatus Wallbacteria bacterium HGW-Wallbacteria-1 TaxID=2013854 RepID=A0A2N1PMJ6_9BACT|nr:MAG: SAM-dependent methyltransferase [Candidatus Wallbacteria bacterium HGW-Wallbacteria-1]